VKVVVLSGGRSSEHEISLRSGASVAEGLAAAGHDALPVIIGRDGRWKQGEDEVELLPGGGLLGADAAFPVLHGPFGEDGTVQGLLESLDVPYVGCDVLSSALCLDKLTFKRLLGYHGTPQVEFVQAGEPDWRRRAEEMGLPLWVKPARLGSSVGISKVGTESELDKAIEAAAAHDPRVIIEASANAREVECSVLGNEDPETSQPGEIVAHADWYDYKSKYSEGGMELVVPAPVGEEAVAAVRALAAEVFAFCGCSGLARCDFFVTEQGEVLVNELNTIPGFTETSVYSKLWEESGVAYPQLCDRLVGLGIERFRASRGFEY
jgi:D-alanine-D-alanine ligase